MLSDGLMRRGMDLFAGHLFSCRSYLSFGPSCGLSGG